MHLFGIAAEGKIPDDTGNRKNKTPCQNRDFFRTSVLSHIKH